MAVEISLPPLGESISEATLLRWLKRVGDEVTRGEELAELETAKAAMPLESPADGILLAVLAEAGSTVVTRQPLAVVGRPGEEWLPAPRPDPKEAGEILPRPPPDRPAGDGGRVSPSASRLAAELGIDIRQVPPSRPGARVVTQDVERFARGRRTPGVPDAGVPSHRVPLTSIRRIVAQRMTESAQQVPQFSVSVEADAGRLLARQEALRAVAEAEGTKLSLTALLVVATARALRAHPLLNARFDGDGVVVFDSIHIAVAVATPQGLTVPVVHGVETKGLAAIARRLAEIAGEAREGKLTPADLSGATFTLSNLGMFGVGQFVPLVNPPQAAVLGVGAVRATVLPAENGTLRPVQLINLTVGADHRVLDGEAVAHFLRTLSQEVQRGDVDW